MRVRVLEHVERRVVAGLIPVGVPARTPLPVAVELAVEEMYIRRNRSGVIALEPFVFPLDAEGNETLPAAGAVHSTIELSDPTLAFLPRRYELDWPTDPLTTPLAVEMLPSPSLRLADAGTVVRGRVVAQGTEDGVGGVLLVATFGGNEVGVAMSAFAIAGDPRTARWTGDYLLLLAGISPVQWGSSVVDPVRLDNADITIQTAAWAGPGPAGRYPDIDELRNNLGAPRLLSVQPGRIQNATIEV